MTRRKTVSLVGVVDHFDSLMGNPLIRIDTVDGKPAGEVFLPTIHKWVTPSAVNDSLWGGHMFEGLRVGDPYEILLDTSMSSFVGYRAKGKTKWLR